MGGSSAGAGSVTLQLTAYGGKDEGLFHATAAESQSFGALRTVSESQYQYDSLVERTNCTSQHTGNKDTLACLRGLDIAMLQENNVNTAFPNAKLKPLFAYNPTLDHDFIPDYTISSFQSGKFVKLPAIYGDATNEGTVFTPKGHTSTTNQSSEFIQAQFPVINSTQLARISEMYPPAEQFPPAGQYWRSTCAAYGEMRYICPGIHLSTLYAQHNIAGNWNYHYNVSDPAAIKEGFGTPHVAELGAIWDFKLPQSLKTTNANMIPLMQGYWISFIRSYDPNKYRQSGSPTWAAWTEGGDMRRLLIQNTEANGGVGAGTVMETVPTAQKGRCDVMSSWAVGLRQ